MLKTSVISLILLAILAVINMPQSYAQDRYSVKISCTIPEIAGVNVPLVKENASAKPAEETSGNPVVFENKKEEIRLVKGEAQAVAVTTIYSR